MATNINSTVHMQYPSKVKLITINYVFAILPAKLEAMHAQEYAYIGCFKTRIHKLDYQTVSWLHSTPLEYLPHWWHQLCICLCAAKVTQQNNFCEALAQLQSSCTIAELFILSTATDIHIFCSNIMNNISSHCNCYHSEYPLGLV